MEKQIVDITENISLIDKLTELGFSYNRALSLLRKQDVRLNGKKVKENLQLCEGDELTIFFLPEYKEKSFKIVYEDENIVICDKPCGIEIEGNDGLAKKLNAIPVHRLDRNTTGLIILAKNISSEKILSSAIKNHKIIKKYYAEVVGKCDFHDFTFNAFLIKDSSRSQVKIYERYMKGSENISTTFNTIKSNATSSLVECTLHTGKTHQIRASLAYLGYPIIGDGKYGKNEINKKFKAKWQRLHSYYLQLDGLEGNLSYLNKKSFLSYPDWIK